MTTLFNPDDYPAGADPVRAWRQAEAELEALKKRLAETPDPAHDERRWDAKDLDLDPAEYEELYRAAQEYGALESTVWDLEDRVKELAAAALQSTKETKP